MPDHALFLYGSNMSNRNAHNQYRCRPSGDRQGGASKVKGGQQHQTSRSAPAAGKRAPRYASRAGRERRIRGMHGMSDCSDVSRSR